jgi:hemin uptake protein HemP
MTRESRPIELVAATEAQPAASAGQPVRFKSEELFRNQREVEIDHEGRIYRLRLTQLNKLILTA